MNVARSSASTNKIIDNAWFLFLKISLTVIFFALTILSTFRIFTVDSLIRTYGQDIASNTIPISFETLKDKTRDSILTLEGISTWNPIWVGVFYGVVLSSFILSHSFYDMMITIIITFCFTKIVSCYYEFHIYGTMYRSLLTMLNNA